MRIAACRRWEETYRRKAPTEGMKGKPSARNIGLQFTWGDVKCGQKASQHSLGKSGNSRRLRPEQQSVVESEMEVSWQTREMGALVMGRMSPGCPKKHMTWFDLALCKGDAEIRHR